jgi:hypothetical protein
MHAPHGRVFDPDSTNDPAGWNAASYTADPIDAMEPPEPFSSEYRECALQLLDVLHAVDQFMCVGNPPRKWLAVSLALGLFSTRGRTETAIAIEWGVTRAAVSKDVVAVLRLARLEDNPAWGLKALKHRRQYMRTNGRRPAHSEAKTDAEPSAGDFPAG